MVCLSVNGDGLFECECVTVCECECMCACSSVRVCLNGSVRIGLCVRV